MCRAVVGHPGSWRRVGRLVREGVGSALQHTACLLVRPQSAVRLLDPHFDLVVDRSGGYGKHVGVLASRHSLRIVPHALPVPSAQGVGSVDHLLVESECNQNLPRHRLVVQSLVQPQNRLLPVGLYRLRHALSLLDRRACIPVGGLAVYHSREDTGPRRGYHVHCRLCRLHVPTPSVFDWFAKHRTFPSSSFVFFPSFPRR